MHQTGNLIQSVVLMALFAFVASAATRGAESERPSIADDRLGLVLFAEDPEIVTPIGAAVDSQDRLFVLESHTHSRPRDYPGPPTDRVKVFEDTDGDGRSDRSSVFAEGLEEGLNLAFAADGTLYAVCSHSVVALFDEDGDGVCDRQETVLRLNTRDRNPHGCLLSVTFSHDGWMYVGRGNTGSRAWTLVGTDGSRITGYGDGGNIARCRPDGSQVEEFATGFWNPMGVQFDHAGRLLCVDNDPDARGPNRLVHVVAGGDYGYRSLFGGGGNHPYQGWNGDLPGTLPFISGTGEAPAGLVDCRFARLPADYQDSVLIAVWNENSIERHQLRPRGLSLVGERQILVTGGKEFRPVAIVPDSRGNLYITDWMLVAYPNHGRGRIWRLSTKEGVDAAGPEDLRLRLPPEPAQSANDLAAIEAQLATDDPFAQHAAVMRLAGDAFDTARSALTQHGDARVRLGCLLAMKRQGIDDAAAIEPFLSDADPRIVRAALIWTGEAGVTQLRPAIDRVLARPGVTGKIVATYLATVRLLDEQFIEAFRSRARDSSRQLVPRLSNTLLRQVARNDSLSAAARAYALRRLEVSADDATWIDDLVDGNDAAMQLRQTGIVKLAETGAAEAVDLLWRIAADPAQDAVLRCDAIFAAANGRAVRAARFVRLLADDHEAVRIAAARAVRDVGLGGAAYKALRQSLADSDSQQEPAGVREALAMALAQPTRRPETLEEWAAALRTGGDAEAGRRVFHSARATCTSCHTVDGLGGALGPALTNVAQSLSREQIIRAILRPSEEFPPQYQAWQIITTDGRTHVGLQLDHKYGGDIELHLTDGIVRHFDADEIDDYFASTSSIMPDGLEATLTVSELRDLVAFLTSLR